MGDDWRLTFEAAQGAEEVEAELRAAAPEGVSVSRRDREVFVYGPTRALVEEAATPPLAAVGRVHRWHPDDGWVEPDAWDEPESEPEPEPAAEPDGEGEWEVVAQLGRVQDARRLIRELGREGRLGRGLWRRIVVSKLTREEAERLGDSIRLQVPTGSRVEARASAPRRARVGGGDLGGGGDMHAGHHGHHGGDAGHGGHADGGDGGDGGGGGD